MNYQLKYLKYKNKYLQLKKLAQTGGNEDCVKFLEELKDLLTDITYDTPCEKLLKKLLIEKTVVKKKFFENPVVIETGETIDESNIGDRIAYPNIIVKEIIKLYNKDFHENEHDQQILDKKCKGFLKSLINHKYYHSGNYIKMLYCPITSKLLDDSVIINPGITYDKEYIDTWLDDGNNTDPIANIEINNKQYYSNKLVNNIIKSLKKYNLIKDEMNDDEQYNEQYNEQDDKQYDEQDDKQYDEQDDEQDDE